MGRAALVAGGLFGLVVLGMAIAHRRLSRHVRYERAEVGGDREEAGDAAPREEPPPAPGVAEQELVHGAPPPQ